MSLREVAGTGDRLETLRALRDRIASQIDETDSARDVAALGQRLMDALGQIDDIEGSTPEQKGTALDDLRARRAARRSGAARKA